MHIFVAGAAGRRLMHRLVVGGHKVMLERAVLDGPLPGIVLRYGNFLRAGSSESRLELFRPTTD